MKKVLITGIILDYSKAKKKLSWEPKVSFEELISMMVDADIKELQKQQLHRV